MCVKLKDSGSSAYCALKKSPQRLQNSCPNSELKNTRGSTTNSSLDVWEISDSKVSLKSWSMTLSGNMSADCPRRILIASSMNSSWSAIFFDQTCVKKKRNELYKTSTSINQHTCTCKFFRCKLRNLFVRRGSSFGEI